MTSVSNMILHKGSSRSMTEFARLANRNRIRGFYGASFQRSLSTITMEDGFRRRTLSANKTSKAKHTYLAWDNSSENSMFWAQRRLRSALPDDYYDDDDEGASSSTDTTGVSKPFLLADIGEGIAEVELLRWFVEEGQVISEFDPVCEVQSDKATVEITSRYEGKVQKLAYSSAGSMIKVGEPILWILEKEDEEQKKQVQQDRCRDYFEAEASATATEISSLPDGENHSSIRQTTEVAAFPEEIESFPERKQQVPSVGAANVETGVGDTLFTESNKVLTSPAVRKIARDHALDLSTITGTGPAGRILKGDVLAVLQDTSTATIAENEIRENSEERDDPLLGEHTVVPLRGYNRIMADTMTASLKIPHMVYSDEINLNRFVKYKMEQQQLDHHNHHEDDSKKLLFLPLAIKAASKALEKYPWLNASFDDDKYEATLWKDHNIGIAMDTPRGLIVPVIKQCQNKSLPELAEELKHLKAAVVEGVGGLPASDLKGATFTLSNVGAIGGGGTYMSPIVTPPQVAIGALGQIRRLPRYVTPSSTDPAQSQTIEEAHICAVSWAADHRVVDGATVARFHKSFKEYMEDPIKLLLELR